LLLYLYIIAIAKTKNIEHENLYSAQLFVSIALPESAPSHKQRRTDHYYNGATLYTALGYKIHRRARSTNKEVLVSDSFVTNN
jgi:hypothetical protein